MQSNQSDCSIHLHHHHLHLNARQNYVYVRMCSTAADPAHSRAEPAPPIVMAGRQLQPWVMVVIPVCLLMSSVLALPSVCVGEPCMVPVGYITTAKPSPPSSSMSEPTRRGLCEVLVSLTYSSSFLHFPDMSLELVVSLELSSVFSKFSLWYSWS